MTDASAAQPLGPDPIDTVEALVRRRLSEALGGRRGILESAVPTAAFTITWTVTHDLRLSLIVAAGLLLGLLVARLVQRSTPQFVLSSLFVLAIAAFLANRTGEARDVFLPGIIYNGVYGLVLVASVVIGWPLVGFILGSLVGDPTGWHDDKGIVRLCQVLTALLAVPCLARVLVQYPLYLADQVTWLGTAKLVMGWPLQVAVLAAMAWMLSRNSTPLDPEPLDPEPLDSDPI